MDWIEAHLEIQLNDKVDTLGRLAASGGGNNCIMRTNAEWKDGWKQLTAVRPTKYALI